MHRTPRRGSLIPSFGPLRGLRVLDSGRFVAGPWASTYLAEFGAEVIHVETPPFGYPYADPTRTLVPVIPEGRPVEEQTSESWVQYYRNKLSVGLDLARPEARKIFLELAGCSDIWIESSRPGTFAKLGLSDAALWKVQPRLTIVHVSGYGQTGVPARLRAPSYDLSAQAFSGYLSLQGQPEPAPPMRAATAILDAVSGLAAAGAALMGHVDSLRTGHGQAIDVAQYEVGFSLLENLAVDYFARGVVRGRHGSGHARLHPYDVYRARDGWVAVAAPNRDAYHRLAGMIGWTDRRFEDPAYRLAHRGPIDRAIARFCRRHGARELEDLARRHDVAIDRVRTIADIARDPHFRARRMLIDWTDPVAGRVRGRGIAPKFARTPGRVWRGAPRLGQDNRRVLIGRLGHSVAELRRWQKSGVIGEAPRPPRRPARGRSRRAR